MRAEARERAAALGPLLPVEPGGRGPDGSPQLGTGQVFATKTGETFHRAWCETVGQVWDQRPKSLFLITEGSVGSRRPCKQCTVV